MSSENKIALDDYLAKNGAVAFQEVIKDARPTLELHLEERTSTDLILTELTRLNNDITRAKIFKLIARQEKAKTDDVEAEYQKHITKNEETKGAKQETFTPEDMEKARELLKSPKILEKMLELTTKLGYVGEDINKMMLFLSFISRLLLNSISAIVKGASASGKSALVKCILSLIPKKDVLSFSFITPKALPHFAKNLSHKILFVQEQPGSQGADYSIRTTISEGEISIALPIKDEASGNFTTIEKRIPAVGMVFVETTTKERVHVENQTRVFN